MIFQRSAEFSVPQRKEALEQWAECIQQLVCPVDKTTKSIQI